MSKEVEKLLGKRVAELRRERGISQAMLSELINVAPETISRLGKCDFKILEFEFLPQPFKYIYYYQ